MDEPTSSTLSTTSSTSSLPATPAKNSRKVKKPALGFSLGLGPSTTSPTSGGAGGDEMLRRAHSTSSNASTTSSSASKTPATSTTTTTTTGSSIQPSSCSVECEKPLSNTTTPRPSAPAAAVSSSSSSSSSAPPTVAKGLTVTKTTTNKKSTAATASSSSSSTTSAAASSSSTTNNKATTAASGTVAGTGAATKPAGKRIRPKLPSMNFDIGLDAETQRESSEVIDVSENAVKPRDAEHLIVEYDTLDSPFIATTGQFPGGGMRGGDSSNSYSSSSSTTTGSASGLDSMQESLMTSENSGSFSNTTRSAGFAPASSNTKLRKTSSSQTQGQQQPQAKKKFFRIDQSNCFVFVDDSETVNDQTEFSHRNQFSQIDNNNKEGGVVGTPSSSSSSFSSPGSSSFGANRSSSSSSPYSKAAGIPFEKLTFGGVLGHGQQGKVYAVSYQGRNFALKKISVSDALDSRQAKVERQARKNGIVRELQMVAARQDHCPYVVHLHNAYFRKEDEQNEDENHSAASSSCSGSSSSASPPSACLYILMERMSISVEDLKCYAAKLPKKEVHETAQRCFGDKIAGSQSAKNKIERKTLQPREYVVSATQRNTALPEIVIACVASDVLKGLKFLHNDLRLVHTDLKCANIMLSENLEDAKIADFGCSQQLSTVSHGQETTHLDDEAAAAAEAAGGGGGGNHASGGRKGEIVVSNVVLGTKLYMSPERARASYGSFETTVSFDEKADIWALGILLLELAAGVHPCDHFREEYWNYASMLRWNNLAKPENMPVDLISFLRRCLDVDPETRASADELLKHEFIKRFEKTNRQKMATFVRAMRTKSEESDRKRMKSEIQSHVTNAATLKRDLQRQSVAAWSGFQKGIVGSVPNHMDEKKFPTLG